VTVDAVRSAEQARQALHALRHEVGKAVVAQDAAVTGLVIALLCRGHVLIEGVPGVAKTLLVRALAEGLALDTKRVQFTPDLMPGDITGSLVYDARSAEFSFRPGPVFTNLLLADEINRTPPKTQASLLEAMEERQVSVDGVGRPLPDPFVVVATQNPVEFEGTYPLPEAQLDRFQLKLTMPLPERDDELAILTRHADGFDPRDLAAAGLTPVALATPSPAASARTTISWGQCTSSRLQAAGAQCGLLRGSVLGFERNGQPHRSRRRSVAGQRGALERRGQGGRRSPTGRGNRGGRRWCGGRAERDQHAQCACRGEAPAYHA